MTYSIVGKYVIVKSGFHEDCEGTILAVNNNTLRVRMLSGDAKNEVLSFSLNQVSVK